jgi:drug/metabolite transporter (DMT)-like permease
MNRAGVLRCLLAAVLFGATAPAASELAGSIPAFTLAGLLYVGAAVAVLPVVLRRPPSRAALASEWRPAAVAVVAGGAVGPVLLVAGLARTNAATASILLNTELPATIVLAALVFREHLGRRLLWSAALITTAGALLTWEPGASVDIGAVLIIAACACWGLDNGVTARIEHLAPEHVVALKGIVAGGANLAIGLLLAGWGTSTSRGDVAAALAIGAAGYGASITLWVKGARDLGAARGQVIFATAPFIGAAIAWIALGEDALTLQIIAMALAAVGVAMSLESGHAHDHRHESLAHDHEHVHDDDHHDHEHADGFTGRHSHRHEHGAIVHAHVHVPDLHHRHGH